MFFFASYILDIPCSDTSFTQVNIQLIQVNNMMEIDDHLSSLMETMSLSKRWDISQRDIENEKPLLSVSALQRHDMYMSDSDSEDSLYEPNQSVSSPQLSANANSPPPLPSLESLTGCRLLQHTHHCLLTDSCRTSNGDYLELIFTHREVLLAYPEGHRQCAIGFSDMASTLEAREWRADRDSDGEAASAFRHEASWVAHSCGY